MRGDVREVADEHQDVCAQHAAGGVGKAADHDGHQLRPCHAFEVRTHHQRRFGLADEDVRGVRERLGARDAHRVRHQAREERHDLLHDPEVVEDGEERAEEDDGRQDLEREEEAWDRAGADRVLNDRIGGCASQPRQVLLQRNRGASGFRRAQGAEDEDGPFTAEDEQRVEDVVQLQKEPRAGRPGEHEEGERKLESQAPEDNPPGEAFAILGDEPCREDEDEDTGRGHQVLHGRSLQCGQSPLRHGVRN